MLSKLGSAANMIVSDIQQNLANAKVGDDVLSATGGEILVEIED
jgi:hypothetical protein